MAADLSVLNFEQDLEEVFLLPDASRWNLERGANLELLASLWSTKEPEAKFQARLLWSTYPGAAPSLKFRDPASGRLDLPAAWPMVRGFRPTNLDACVNWCAEGLVTHPEWNNDPRFRWDPRGNAILRVLRILQDELDEHYTGRYRG